MARFTKPGDVVVHIDIGQPGYLFGDIRFIDAFGLVSRFECDFLLQRRTTDEMKSHIQLLKPSVIFFLLNTKNRSSVMRVLATYEREIWESYKVVAHTKWWGNHRMVAFARKDALKRKVDPRRMRLLLKKSPGLRWLFQF